MTDYKTQTILNCLNDIISSYRRGEPENTIVGKVASASNRLKRFPELFDENGDMSLKHWEGIQYLRENPPKGLPDLGIVQPDTEDWRRRF